jgi:SAM-dependent methyltransferase
MAGGPSADRVVHRIGRHDVPEDWSVVGETAGSFTSRLRSGFFAAYMAGDVILDVGYRGSFAEAKPIFPHAIGVDLDYPGYDGRVLPFADDSVDTVFSSHMLEHVADYVGAIRDWYRVVRDGGFIVCIVPHQFLYEKRWSLPSRWNGDHKRFYTPASLLQEFEAALEPNSYRVRHLRDNDADYTYSIGPDEHAGGRYEIELVIEKRPAPSWTLAGGPPSRTLAVEPSSRPIGDVSAYWFDAAIACAVDEILRRRPSLLRSGLGRLARFLSPGRSARVCAEEAHTAKQWARAARFYADALIAEPGAADLWIGFAEMLEQADRPGEAALARRRAAELRRPGL